MGGGGASLCFALLEIILQRTTSKIVLPDLNVFSIAKEIFVSAPAWTNTQFKKDEENVV